MKTAGIYAAETIGAALIANGIYAIYPPAAAIFLGCAVLVAVFALDR